MVILYYLLIALLVLLIILVGIKLFKSWKADDEYANDKILNVKKEVFFSGEAFLQVLKNVFTDNKDHRYQAGKRIGLGTAAEVFKTREGVCGEMGILYVVMARAIGLKSNYVEVNVDDTDRRVDHACVYGFIKAEDPAGNVVRRTPLINPAYPPLILNTRSSRFSLTNKLFTTSRQ